MSSYLSSFPHRRYLIYLTLKGRFYDLPHHNILSSMLFYFEKSSDLEANGVA